MNITPPKYVRQVLKTIQSRGHLAYIVGGCVRDMILGIQPQDWDICTSALPEQVMEMFPDSRPTGIKHGTVTVNINSKSLEVTTFRSEGKYTDHRHPEAVTFVGDLTTDLSRRDFTMNAIAVPLDGLVADPFRGTEDIKNAIIRCVGEPEQRFEEDALRMFRALRFAARLDFEIEENTYSAIFKKAYLAEKLAAERVRDEVEKMLLTKSPQIIHELISLGLMDSYIIRKLPDEKMLCPMADLPRKAVVRWMALCAVLEKYECIQSTEAFLLKLRLDSRSIKCCMDGTKILRSQMPSSPVGWKRLLNRYGVDTVSCAAQCSDVFYGGSRQKELKNILKSGECFSMKHLAVTGDDLLGLGFQGRDLGEMLNFLLDYVMEFPDNNQKELLLGLVKSTEE